MNCSDIEQTQLLAKHLGGVTILRKGQTDIITNGDASEKYILHVHVPVT